MKLIFFKIKVFFLLLFFVTVSVNAQVLTNSQIDSLVQKTMKTFDVPGMAVAVIKDGKIYHKNTYGRSISKRDRI